MTLIFFSVIFFLFHLFLCTFILHSIKLDLNRSRLGLFFFFNFKIKTKTLLKINIFLKKKIAMFHHKQINEEINKLN